MLSSPLKLNILTVPVLSIVLMCLNSCKAPVSRNNPAPSRQLRVADSLIVAGQYIAGKKVLEKIRPEIHDDDPFISTYYCYQASLNHVDPNTMNRYADSALAFFGNTARVEHYPLEYRKALLTKGDACVRARKYVDALNYYARCKIIKPANFCDNGDVDEKIGGIYYDQGNYLIAARYFVERLRRFLDCSDHASDEKKVITLQGILNNIGYFYEQANIPDSAIYYYQKDIKLIDSAETHKLEALRNINAAKAVVYDNLGGLYAKLGKTTQGKNLLLKSILLSNEETDRTKVATYIKLADIYIGSGEFKKAGESLVNGRQLLEKYSDSDPDFKSRWTRTYAAYLFKTKRSAQAYTYLNDYISHKDSMLNSRSELYHLDIAREITSLQRQNQLADLQQKEKLRKLYQLGIVLVSLLSAVIIILIVRNLRKMQKAKEKTTAHNEQLQQAIAEIERVNQNYIRIMRVMAHDLRNPLGGITGLAQLLLEDDELSEDSRHMLILITSTSKHSLGMINELLESGLGGNAIMPKAPVDINTLLYECVELLQFKAKEKNQHIEFQNSRAPVIIPVNYEKIWRVFNNIIVNALKFSHTNDIIKVALTHKPDHVLISVADNGIGIPDKSKDSIFEMFTPSKRVGTNGEQPFGLGLSISKNIVEKHGGSIWFKSKDGEGTIFFVSLPVK